MDMLLIFYGYFMGVLWICLMFFFGRRGFDPPNIYINMDLLKG